MNEENIKSELQQVLDSDMALRKEYNEIKRSLSDYRNQLIQRDEEYKRLQVSIDVLNTKLLVLERDNSNYKSEVTSFRELRNSIREQLQEKQDEINTLLAKIDELTGELSNSTSEYELKINELQTSSQNEISTLKATYESQLEELKSNTSYQQIGIRNELEAKINDLTNTYDVTYKETVSSYEAQIEQLKTEFGSQLENLKHESETRITSLSGTSEETISVLTNQYETQISELTEQWNYEKSEITSSYESQITSLTTTFNVEKSELIRSFESQIELLNNELTQKQQQFEAELSSTIETLTQSFTEKENEIKSFYEAQLLNTSSSSSSLLDSLKEEFETKIADLTSELTTKQNSFETELNSTIESLTKEHIEKENELRSFYEAELLNKVTSSSDILNSLKEEYETRISDLNSELSSHKESFEAELNATIVSLTEANNEKTNELKSYYETELSNYSSVSTSSIDILKEEYEEKLINTSLEYSTKNAQLSDDLNKTVLENEYFKEKIREMVYHIDEQNSKIESLNKDIELKAQEISKQIDAFNLLSQDFDAQKSNQLLQIDEQVSILNAKISEFEFIVAEKESKNAELTSSLEDKINQLKSLNHSYYELQNQIDELLITYKKEKEDFENFRNEVQVAHHQELESKTVEFNKLLAENTSLINEIDTTADKLEACEEELKLTRTELDELKTISEGKSQDLKDLLNEKNYEMTTLSANHVALQTEFNLLKAELENVRGELKVAESINESSSTLQDEYDQLLSVKKDLENQLVSYQSSVESLNTEVHQLNSSISGYETEIKNLRSSTKADEQDAFIDRLFKQIDILNSERLSLLNEKEELLNSKEEMANQLLKMNDTVATISQHIDHHDIDTTELDSHRKNVILAGGSSNNGSDKSLVKKQINELVREIDKCIALLSA